MTQNTPPPESKELRLFDIKDISDDEAIEKFLDMLLGPEKPKAEAEQKDNG